MEIANDVNEQGALPQSLRLIFAAAAKMSGNHAVFEQAKGILLPDEPLSSFNIAVFHISLDQPHRAK